MLLTTQFRRALALLTAIGAKLEAARTALALAALPGTGDGASWSAERITLFEQALATMTTCEAPWDMEQARRLRAQWAAEADARV